MQKDPTLQSLLDAVDLPALIEAELRALGRDWTPHQKGSQVRGRCPFRDDSGSSRFVIRDGSFVCYGDNDPRCAGSGDAITFLRALHGWSFQRARERLSEFTGIALPKRRGKPDPQTLRVGLIRAIARTTSPSEPPEGLSELAVKGWERACIGRVTGRLAKAQVLRDELVSAGATDALLEQMHLPRHSSEVLSEPHVIVDSERAVRMVQSGLTLGADGAGAAGWAALRADREAGAFGYTTDWVTWLEWLGQGRAGALALNDEKWDVSVRLPHRMHREQDPILVVPAGGASRRTTATLGRWLLPGAPRLRVMDLKQDPPSSLVHLPTYPEWMAATWATRTRTGGVVRLEQWQQEMAHVLQQLHNTPERLVYQAWWKQAYQALARDQERLAAGVSSTQRRPL